MRYIKSFANDAAIQAAVDDKSLGHPYVALDDQLHRIDWDGKIPSPEGLRITNRTSNSGSIVFTKDNHPANLILKTKVNGGAWSDSVVYSATTTFTLPANSYVEFKGENTSMNTNTSYWKITVGVDFDLSGELTSLISASTISECCFMNLFGGNTHLINTSGLTITGTGKNAYQGLFLDCTNLVSAPKLIAELPLETQAYNSMFKGCTSLTAAPDLDFASIDSNVCAYMFRGCSSLNYVRCLATNRPTQLMWLDGVSTTGTFVKAAGANWQSGAHGIPSGWTVIEE